MDRPTSTPSPRSGPLTPSPGERLILTAQMLCDGAGVPRPASLVALGADPRDARRRAA